MADDIGPLLGPIAIGWTAGHVGFGPAFATVACCTALVAIMGLGTRETLTSHEIRTETVSVVEEASS